MAWNFSLLDDDTTEIFIYDEIADKQRSSFWSDEKGTQVTPNTFNEELKKVTTNNICVRINSRGGDVFAAEAIRTAIREKRAEGKTITCKVDGFCGSAAVGVSVACDKTLIPASAWFMIHDPYIFAFGYYDIPQLKKDMTMLEKIKQGTISAYAEKTGKDKKEISELMTAETWYTGEEAVESGFCDELMFEDLNKSDSDENPGNFSLYDISMYKNIPLALIDRAVVNSVGFSHINKTQNKNKEGGDKTMEPKTVEELRAAYPELTAQLAETAAASERKRIQDIENIALPGFEEIVGKAKFETPQAAADVAMQIVAEQKKQGANYLANVAEDVKNSKAGEVTSSGQEGAPENKANPYDAAIDKLYPDKK